MKILGKELTFNGNKVYHAGNKPTVSEIGAAAASHGRHMPDTCETITDWNNATKNGWYMGNNAANGPTTVASGGTIWYFGEVITHNTNYVIQVVYQFTANTDAKSIPKYIRAKMNGTWGAWTNVTVSKAVPSNAVFTDTNTWRGVQDNLTSTATDQSLSANQGKVLKGLIDGKAASNHTHSYLPLSGGTMTGAISSSLNTGTYLDGNKGRALVNSTNTAGGYTALVKSNSTNGYFTQATYQGNHLLQYTAKSTVDAGNNSVTKTATLLNESGNSSFPGTVTAPTFSGALSGNATTATKLQTARTINGTNFDGTGNITTANWGTARNLNGVSVNGSTNYTIPVENYYCNVGDNNTNLYHRILTTDIATASWVDKSLIIVMHSGYQGGGFGIAKITFRTNDISSAASSQGEIKWLVRNGFAANALVFNFVNQAKNACMDIFYKSPGTYAGMTWYVLSEGGRGGAHSKQWTKYNTNASGTNAYTEANMKTLRTYTSTLVSATDAGHVSTANSASTLSTARTINGTSFNGSANITTANWGTARTITIGKTAKSVNGSANVSWTAAEIGVASIDDSTTATGTVWSSNKTQVQINTSYNTMSQKVDALEESINRDFVSKNGSTMTGDLTIKKSNGDAAKLNVHRTINSNDMQGTIDIYSHNGGSVALSTNNKTSGKQASSYVFGGDAFWSPRNADGTVPSIGLSNYRFEKAWFNKLDAKDAIFTSGNLTVQGQTTLGPTILNNNTFLYGYNTSGTQINICGVDNSNNIYLGWNNQTYINVNNTMRVYRDLHILNGNALRVTGQTVLARTESCRQIAVVSTAGDGNDKGDGQTHLGYFDNGYHHYFRGSGAMHVDMLGGLRIDGKRLSIGSAAHSNPATGDVWIQI